MQVLFHLCNAKVWAGVQNTQPVHLRVQTLINNGAHCNNIYVYFVSIYLLALLVLLQYQLLYLFIIFC